MMPPEIPGAFALRNPTRRRQVGNLTPGNGYL